MSSVGVWVPWSGNVCFDVTELTSGMVDSTIRVYRLTFPTPVPPVNRTDRLTDKSRSIRYPYRTVSIVGTSMSKNGTSRLRKRALVIYR